MQQQREYVSHLSANFDEGQHFQLRQPRNQRTLLAGLSFGLWTLLCLFVLWENSGDLYTATRTAYTFIVNGEHVLLALGLIIFSGLLVFTNLIFRPQEQLFEPQPLIHREDHEKIQPQTSFLTRLARFLRHYNPLVITLSSFVLVIVTFLTVVWQISENAYSLMKYFLYDNRSLIATAQLQTMWALILMFVLISGLVFYLNFLLYSRKFR
ncbi:MAG TPA: hypothetical protein VL461_14075 [Dictyobacter sp.]|jgi:hypothetical protein|nr:hypothetical protein [Dictyobacter sp.]